MLEKCVSGQWKVDDLDWTRPPAPMSRDKEQAIVQYFTDMSGIERLAAALFEEQGRRTTDPVLGRIFASFVEDELRHSQVALRLARHYDVHHYREYAISPPLRRFSPHFVHAIRFLSAEYATVYITTGELILDVALLRSLDDYVDEPTCAAAMRLVNQDESRHIAIDFHMIEYYASDAYQRDLAGDPSVPLREQVRAWWAFAQVFLHVRPFFRTVFAEPMRRTDPGGKRIREAFKRIQLLSAKPRVAARPFNRFLLKLQQIHNHPIGSRVLGRILVRVTGVDREYLQILYSPDEFRRAADLDFDQLAAEALAAKSA